MLSARALDNFTYGHGHPIGGGVVGLIAPERANRAKGVVDNFSYEEKEAEQVEMLQPSRQRALLLQAPLAETLHLGGYRIVLHDETATMAMARNPAPLVGAASPCHAELLLANLTYTRVYAHGHSLKSLVILREFGPAHELKQRAAIPIEAALTTSPKEEQRTPEAFAEDLERAFLDTIGLFARARDKAQDKGGKAK